jgi:hypothetical protein
MKTSNIKNKLFAVVAGATAALPHVAHAALVVPNGATPPFEDWNREDPYTAYAEWNTFTSPNGGTNAPDVGQFGPPTANLVNNGAFAIITGGGNLYSFAGVTDFDVTVPNYGFGEGRPTRVVAQLLTATGSTPLAGGSMRLTYDDGGGNQTLLPDQVVAPGSNAEWLFVWDIPFNPASLLLEFNASDSSMSLDRFVVDTFTVPEPGAVVLIAICVGIAGIAARRRRS